MPSAIISSLCDAITDISKASLQSNKEQTFSDFRTLIDSLTEFVASPSLAANIERLGQTPELLNDLKLALENLQNKADPNIGIQSKNKPVNDDTQCRLSLQMNIIPIAI